MRWALGKLSIVITTLLDASRRVMELIRPPIGSRTPVSSLVRYLNPVPLTVTFHPAKSPVMATAKRKVDAVWVRMSAGSPDSGPSILPQNVQSGMKSVIVTVAMIILPCGEWQ